MKRLLYKIYRPFYIWWCNYYWKHCRETQTECKLRICDVKHKDESISDYIKKMAARLMEKFEYTSDGEDQLYDSMPPPAEAYSQFINGELADDCDGFAAAMYHIAQMSGIDSKIVSVLSTKNKYGHAVMMFYDGRKWKINDYKTVYSLDVAKDVYQDLAKEYMVYAAEYDYTKHKYRDLGEINEF